MVHSNTLINNISEMFQMGQDLLQKQAAISTMPVSPFYLKLHDRYQRQLNTVDPEVKMAHRNAINKAFEESHSEIINSSEVIAVVLQSIIEFKQKLNSLLEELSVSQVDLTKLSEKIVWADKLSSLPVTVFKLSYCVFKTTGVLIPNLNTFFVAYNIFNDGEYKFKRSINVFLGEVIASNGVPAMTSVARAFFLKSLQEGIASLNPVLTFDALKNGRTFAFVESLKRMLGDKKKGTGNCESELEYLKNKRVEAVYAKAVFLPLIFPQLLEDEAVVKFLYWLGTAVNFIPVNGAIRYDVKNEFLAIHTKTKAKKFYPVKLKRFVMSRTPQEMRGAMKNIGGLLQYCLFELQFIFNFFEKEPQVFSHLICELFGFFEFCKDQAHLFLRNYEYYYDNMALENECNILVVVSVKILSLMNQIQKNLVENLDETIVSFAKGIKLDSEEGIAKLSGLGELMHKMQSKEEIHGGSLEELQESLVDVERAFLRSCFGEESSQLGQEEEKKAMVLLFQLSVLLNPAHAFRTHMDLPDLIRDQDLLELILYCCDSCMESDVYSLILHVLKMESLYCSRNAESLAQCRNLLDKSSSLVFQSVKEKALQKIRAYSFQFMNEKHSLMKNSFNPEVYINSMETKHRRSTRKYILPVGYESSFINLAILSKLQHFQYSLRTLISACQRDPSNKDFLEELDTFYRELMTKTFEAFSRKVSGTEHALSSQTLFEVCSFLIHSLFQIPYHDKSGRNCSTIKDSFKNTIKSTRGDRATYEEGSRQSTLRSQKTASARLREKITEGYHRLVDCNLTMKLVYFSRTFDNFFNFKVGHNNGLEFQALSIMNTYSLQKLFRFIGSSGYLELRSSVLSKFKTSFINIRTILMRNKDNFMACSLKDLCSANFLKNFWKTFKHEDLFNECLMFSTLIKFKKIFDHSLREVVRREFPYHEYTIKSCFDAAEDQNPEDVKFIRQISSDIGIDCQLYDTMMYREMEENVTRTQELLSKTKEIYILLMHSNAFLQANYNSCLSALSNNGILLIEGLISMLALHVEVEKNNSNMKGDLKGNLIKQCIEFVEMASSSILVTLNETKEEVDGNKMRNKLFFLISFVERAGIEMHVTGKRFFAYRILKSYWIN